MYIYVYACLHIYIYICESATCLLLFFCPAMTMMMRMMTMVLFFVVASSLTLIKVGGNYTTPAGWSAHVGAIYYIRPETVAFNNVADEEVVGPRERTPRGVFCRHHGGEA